MLKRALTIILACGSLFSYGQTYSVTTETVSAGPVTMSYDIRDYSLAGNNEDSHFYIGLDSGWEKINSADSASVSYKNVFETDRSWLDRNIFLVTNGDGQAIDITVNGKKAGHSTGRGVLRICLNGFTVTGKNEVTLTYSVNPCKYYTGQVKKEEPVNTYIFSQPRICITDYNISAFTDGKGNGILNTGIVVRNGYNTDEEVTVGYDVTDMDGDIITYNSNAGEMKKGETREFVLSRKIAEVKKWSPEHPYLYTVTFRVRHNERYIEYITVKTGFRDIELADGKLYINGNETVLNGHIAEKPDFISVSELKKLKKNGVNCVTWKVQPVGERIYDLCDSLGIFVCDNIAVNGTEKNTSDIPSLKEVYLETARSSFQRHKNRPSVIMWSLGDDNANGYNLYKSYLYLKNLDSARPVITKAAKAEWNTDMATAGTTASSDTRGVILFTEESIRPGKHLIGTFSK